MFTILPGFGVSTSEFRVPQALAEPSDSVEAGVRGLGKEFFRSGTDRLRCPLAFRVISAATLVI